MKFVGLFVGILLFVLGLHWMGQGSGYFTWPSNPVMDDHFEWVYYGGVAFILGIVVIVLSRRMSR
jgi:hypothetical protein